MAKKTCLPILGLLVLTWWTSGLVFTTVPRFGGIGASSQHVRTAFAGLPASFQVGSTESAAAALSVIAAACLTRRGAVKGSAASVKAGRVRPADAELRSERAKASHKVGYSDSLASRIQRLFSFRNRTFWDYTVYPRMYFARHWQGKDVGYILFFIAIHLGACAAPFYFTKQAFLVFIVGYIVTGMFGITLSYHRQLAHGSFQTPKWLEYAFAYCGALALQSHPINWCSSHRHHHGGCETEKDVHSPLDGFWWAHAGWLLDQKNTWMRQDKSNAVDLQKQWFYRFLAKTYPLHGIVLPLVCLYACGGLPFVFWGFFARVVWVWHVTWAVNSVSHVWGFQDWNTGDKSMNNWLVGIFAFGEGWHNNHHAFETSCRHGLKWWMMDWTWYTIKALEFVGLARNLKYPSEGKMKKLSFSKV